MIGTMAKPKRKIRKLWSTGHIGDLVGVTAKQVAKWIDCGELKGIKLPDLTERRVQRQDLRNFLAKYEFIWALRELDIEEGVPEVLPESPKPTRQELRDTVASMLAPEVLPEPAKPARKKPK